MRSGWRCGGLGLLVGGVLAGLDMLFFLGVPTLSGWRGPFIILVGWYAVLGAAGGFTFGWLGSRVLGARSAICEHLVVIGAGAAQIGVILHTCVLQSAGHAVTIAADLGLAGAALAAVSVLAKRGRVCLNRPIAVIGALLLSGQFVYYSVAGPRSFDVPAPVERPGDHPNLLFLMVDTLRADHCSLYGYDRRTTPNLDAFAADATVFDRAYSTSAWTKPSVATMFTGLEPPSHGVESYFGALPESAATLAEVLRAAGYRTGIFSDNAFVSAGFGFGQGFEHLQYPLGWDIGLMPWRRLGRGGPPCGSQIGRGLSWLLRRLGGKADEWFQQERVGAAVLNRRLRAWLGSGESARPWFAYVNYVEPHWPYGGDPAYECPFAEYDAGLEYSGEAGFAPWITGPDLGTEEAARQALAYDRGIAYWDDEFGRLLAWLAGNGDLDHTVVVVVGDHGEGFFEHGTWAHGNSLHEELIRVPLVIRRPSGGGSRIGEGVSLLHLASALLDVAGYESPPSFSRAGSIWAPGRERIYSSTRMAEFRALSVVDGNTKWIVGTKGSERIVQKFDLANDPRETRNLFAGDPEDERVAAALLARQSHLRENGLKQGAEVDTAELDSHLEGLGYLK